MRELKQEDLERAVDLLPQSLMLSMQSDRVMVGGGFIRSIITGEPINDVDVFIPSYEKAVVLKDQVVEQLHRVGPTIIQTENAFTIKGAEYPIQIIHRWTFDSPEQLINSFDFTMARAALYWDGQWKSLVDDDFYVDLAARRLCYRAPIRIEEAGGSMLRAVKFLMRGWRISPEHLACVMARACYGIDPSLPEAAMAIQLNGRLREVDPGQGAAQIDQIMIPEAEEDFF